MSFDNSRYTFNPRNDYSGVVMQQGRVQLDSDWNEWLGGACRAARRRARWTSWAAPSIRPRLRMLSRSRRRAPAERTR